MDFIDYREKLGIGFSDRELEKYFFNRIFNILDTLNIMSEEFSGNDYLRFCSYTGQTVRRNITEGECWETVLRILRNNNSSVREFLSYYMFMINCQENTEHKSWLKEQLTNMVRFCLNDSHIPCEVYEEKGSYYVFPKGAKELDDALIAGPLMWLKDYPKSHKAFVKALKAYSEVTEENASDVADLFRKSLETFFQEFFKSDKSLENLKSEYGNFLGKKGVPGEIKNNFEKLLESYTNYNNNYAKHHDKASLNVLEYIMYQTGNLIRLIITLNQEDDVNAD